MIDAIYLLATLVFFALMIGYVAACARLGQSTAEGADARDGEVP